MKLNALFCDNIVLIHSVLRLESLGCYRFWSARAVARGGGGLNPPPPPVLGKSLNPISTRGEHIIPTQYY